MGERGNKMRIIKDETLGDRRETLAKYLYMAVEACRNGVTLGYIERGYKDAKKKCGYESNIDPCWLRLADEADVMIKGNEKLKAKQLYGRDFDCDMALIRDDDNVIFLFNGAEGFRTDYCALYKSLKSFRLKHDKEES